MTVVFGSRANFLTRAQSDAIHQDQIETFGGLHGIRSENALESAIAQPLNVWCYGGGDLFKTAATYAFHVAERQVYFDGNKRTAVQAALDFLEINGIDTDPLPEAATYQAMFDVANHELNRVELAAFLRDTLEPR